MTKAQLSQFIDELEQIMPLFARHFHQSALAGLINIDVTMNQFLVLQFLQHHGDCMMSDLASAFGVTLGNVTTMVDRLVREKLVSRAGDLKDRRVVRVQLTKKASNIIKKICEQKKGKLLAILSRVPEADLKTVLKIMRKIVALIEQEKRGAAKK